MAAVDRRGMLRRSEAPVPRGPRKQENTIYFVFYETFPEQTEQRTQHKQKPTSKYGLL